MGTPRPTAFGASRGIRAESPLEVPGPASSVAFALPRESDHLSAVSGGTPAAIIRSALIGFGVGRVSGAARGLLGVGILGVDGRAGADSRFAGTEQRTPTRRVRRSRPRA